VYNVKWEQAVRDGAPVMVTHSGWFGSVGQAALWKTSPNVDRCPERMTDTPCRTGPIDHPREERTGRSRVVKTRPCRTG
jgi:hypothetical protein